MRVDESTSMPGTCPRRIAFRRRLAVGSAFYISEVRLNMFNDSAKFERSSNVEKLSNMKKSLDYQIFCKLLKNSSAIETYVSQEDPLGYWRDLWWWSIGIHLVDSATNSKTGEQKKTPELTVTCDIVVRKKSQADEHSGSSCYIDSRHCSHIDHHAALQQWPQGPNIAVVNIPAMSPCNYNVISQ